MSTMKPQELLDKIHATGIFQEDWKNFPTQKARLDKIRIYREKLRQIQRQLKESEDNIKAIFDGRNQLHAIYERLNLIPYSMIKGILEDISIWLRKLEAGEAVIPLKYGTEIFGDIDEGHWEIGDKITAEQWRIKHSAKELKIQINNANSQIKSYRKISQSTIEFYYASVFIIIGMAVIFVISITGGYLSTSYILFGLGLIFVGIWMHINWKKKRQNASAEIVKLEELIKNFEEQLTELKISYRQLSKN